MKKLSAKELAANAGLDAAMAGKSRDDNPYHRDHPLYKWWDVGWLEAD